MKDRHEQPGDLEGDDDALWALLGKGPEPRVSPYFARRVLREVVRSEEERGWLRRLVAGWRSPHPAWSGAFAAGLVCLVTLSFAYHPAPGHQRRRENAFADPREEIKPGDVEVIANLDNLMAYDENKIWVDDSNAD